MLIPDTEMEPQMNRMNADKQKKCVHPDIHPEGENGNFESLEIRAHSRPFAVKSLLTHRP